MVEKNILWDGLVILRERIVKFVKRGRPVLRWKDMVKEYMHERVADRGKGLSYQEGSAWIGRDGGSSAMAIPFGERGIRDYRIYR